MVTDDANHSHDLTIHCMFNLINDHIVEGYNLIKMLLL